MKNSVTELPFNRFIGIETAADPQSILRLPAGEKYLNHLGTVHASALLALAEASSGEFLLRHFGSADGIVPVVRRLESKFRKPANGAVTSKASADPEALAQLSADLAAKGRALITINIDIHDESGAHALNASVEWFIQHFMNPETIAKTYDKLAPIWDANDFHRANGIEQHRRAFRFAGEKRAAIDVGCGSSGRIIDLLISEGYETEGLDISPEMIRLAKLRHPEVTFHLADIREWKASKNYDFISAWDSIWHAPLADHESILGKLCAALNPGGVLIFTSGGLDEPGEAHDPLHGEPMYHAAPGIPKLLEIISREECICRHLEYDQHPELHVYLIIQKPWKK